MSRDSVGNTFLVAGLLCVGCSVLVSAAAVGLKGIQNEKRQAFKKDNILQAAGFEEKEYPEARKLIKDVLIDLNTGEEIPEGEYPAEIDSNLATFSGETIAKEPELGINLKEEGKADPAGIKRRENYEVIYKILKSEGSDEVTQYVLPIRGKGLWSTLYGFIAVEPDLETVAGLTFYKHGETPGLGGEVDNKNWKGQWKNLKIYNSSGDVQLEVVKGSVPASKEDYAVDGLSGATITSNGVENLVQFWLGPEGYGPYLDNLRKNKE